MKIEVFSQVGRACRCGRRTLRSRKGQQARCWECGATSKKCDCRPLSEGRTIRVSERVCDSAEFAAQFLGMDVSEWIAWAAFQEARRVRDQIDAASPMVLLGLEEPDPRRPVPLGPRRRG
jgi:hypothetical protein